MAESIGTESLPAVLAAGGGRPDLRARRLAEDAFLALRHVHGDWQILSLFGHDLRLALDFSRAVGMALSRAL